MCPCFHVGYLYRARKDNSATSFCAGSINATRSSSFHQPTSTTAVSLPGLDCSPPPLDHKHTNQPTHHGVNCAINSIAQPHPADIEEVGFADDAGLPEAISSAHEIDA